VYRETLQLPGQFLSRQPSKDSSDIANYIRELHPSGGFVMEEVVYLCSRTWQCLVKYNICAMWEIESNVAVSLRWVVRDCELSRQNFCHAYARQRYHGSIDQLIYYIVNILYLLTDSTASSETQMAAMQSQNNNRGTNEPDGDRGVSRGTSRNEIGKKSEIPWSPSRKKRQLLLLAKLCILRVSSMSGSILGILTFHEPCSPLQSEKQPDTELFLQVVFFILSYLLEWWEEKRQLWVNGEGEEGGGIGRSSIIGRMVFYIFLRYSY